MPKQRQTADLVAHQQLVVQENARSTAFFGVIERKTLPDRLDTRLPPYFMQAVQAAREF